MCHVCHVSYVGVMCGVVCGVMCGVWCHVSCVVLPQTSLRKTQHRPAEK